MVRKEPNFDGAVRQESVIMQATEEIAKQMFDQGVSRHDLSKRLGVNRSYITNQMRGGNFTLRTLSDWADALGCDLEIKLVPRSSAKEDQAV